MKSGRRWQLRFLGLVYLKHHIEDDLIGSLVDTLSQATRHSSFWQRDALESR
jgi:hypothetical protein